MAVPARPVAGAPVETSWGDVVHDTVVALDIQYGNVIVPANAGTATVTFARPFAAPPVVLSTPATNSKNYMSAVGVATVTNCAIVAMDKTFVSPASAIGVNWIAIGPRA